MALSAANAFHVDESGPDFVLEELETYLNQQVYSDLNIISKESLAVSAHCAVLCSVSTYLKEVIAEGFSPFAQGPITVCMPFASYDDIRRLLHLVYLGEVSIRSTEKARFLALLETLRIDQSLDMSGLAGDDTMTKIQMAHNGVPPHRPKVITPTVTITPRAQVIKQAEDDISDDQYGELEEEAAAEEDISQYDDEEDESLHYLEPHTEMTIDDDDTAMDSSSEVSQDVPSLQMPPMHTWQPLPVAPLPMPQLPLPPSITIERTNRAKLNAVTTSVTSITSDSHRNQLDQHTRDMLTQIPGEVSNSGGAKYERCKCPNCQDVGGRPAMMGEVTMHICHYPECGKQYKKTSHLRAHLRSHIGDQPYMCSWPNCGKKFTRSDELHRHFRIHTGEKKHSCPHCDKKFSRSDHLKKHLTSHLKNNIPTPFPTMMGYLPLPGELGIKQEMPDEDSSQFSDTSQQT
eukprot:snap_masked-scaffold495_size155559-processed-gene-0.17 protein:Tk09248 transcript:snap_masked-scaffold495_size155559-processed-gene-0.17-mRNA-1 annotation:"unnamed protein product"